MKPRSRLALRANGLRSSRIIRIAQQASCAGAADLAMGTPEDAAAAFLKDAATDAINGDLNQYADPAGLMELRVAVAARAQQLYGVSLDAESQISITCGATGALFATLTALLDPDDEVVIFEPFYENYLSVVVLLGARVRLVKLDPDTWDLLPGSLEAAISPKTKVVIVNSPNNPLGKIWSQLELESIVDTCRERGILCLSDEIYEHAIYDGADHMSLLSSGDPAIVIGALSKTFTVTGWRVGYVVAPADVTAALRKVHEIMSVVAPVPLQAAAIKALKVDASFYSDFAARHQARRDFLLDVLVEVGFECRAPAGSFYLMAGTGEFAEYDSVQLAQLMIEKVGVAAVPGSFFYADDRDGARYMRFCFAKSERTLSEAGERLRGLRNAITGTRSGC